MEKFSSQRRKPLTPRVTEMLSAILTIRPSDISKNYRWRLLIRLPLQHMKMKNYQRSLFAYNWMWRKVGRMKIVDHRDFCCSLLILFITRNKN